MKHHPNRVSPATSTGERRPSRFAPALRAAIALPALLASLAAPPLLAPPLHAQQPINLKGLVVTANRWAEPEWTVASHATVIEGEDLARAGIEYVADALRRVPGLAVARNGSFGAVTSVFLRGGESDYVQVLIDGVPVNEPGGAFDFASLTTDNIERIEIIRGPASALYGSDAVSGVIQIFTRRGAGPASGTLSVHAGSFGTRRWQGALSGGTDALSYAFSLGRNATDGILEFNNDYRQTTFTGRIQGRLDSRADATLNVRYDDRRFHFPTDGSGALTDHNAYSFGDALSLSLDAGRRWTDALETHFTFDVHESDRGSDDAADGPADTLGFFGYTSLNDIRRASGGARAILRPGGGTALAAGYELEQQSIRGFSRSFSQYGPSASSSEDDRRNHAGYAQLSWTGGGVAVNGGVRTENNERFGTAATWRAGAAWRSASEGTRLRIAAGTGIKEPTFFETYASGFTTGNPDLEPEHSTSFEAGLDQELGSVATLSLTGFRQSYRDLIQYTFSPPTPGGPNYHNVAMARSRGVETEATFGNGPFRLTGTYSYLDTEVEDAGFHEGPGATFVEGEPLLRRPRHTASAAAFVQIASTVGLDVSVRRTGERADRDFSTYPSTPVTLPSHTVADLSASFEVAGSGSGRPGLTLTVRAENLFDAVYEEIWGFQAPGRGLYVGGSVALGGPHGP
ncbi:MAG: TonB-dependent receptor [Gemmatimonadetes bacterium]|nr:TonB-dependent receptor [Gemmatimonadota bacterium]